MIYRCTLKENTVIELRKSIKFAPVMYRSLYGVKNG